MTITEYERRIADLLEANNRYLDRARDAEAALREADRLYSTYGLLAQASECGAWINRVRAIIAKTEGSRTVPRIARAIYEARFAHETSQRNWTPWDDLQDDAKAVWERCARAAMEQGA